MVTVSHPPVPTTQEDIERQTALEMATELALRFDALKGAPLLEHTPIDSDRFARWAIRTAAHEADDQKRAALLLAAGFVLMTVACSTPAALAIAWPGCSADLVLASHRFMSGHDFAIVAEYHAGQTAGGIMRRAHDAAPEEFKGGLFFVGLTPVGGEK